MTRLYFRVGNVRLRSILILLTCTIIFNIVNLFAFHILLQLPETPYQRLVLIFTMLPTIVSWILSVYSWRYLKPVATLLQSLSRDGCSSTAAREDARVVALRFPLSLSIVGISTSFAAIIAALPIVILLYNIELTFALTLAFTICTEIVIVFAFLYLRLRRLMRPIVAHLHREVVPKGTRFSVRSKITFAIVALSLASTVPMTLIGIHRLWNVQHRAYEQRRLHLTELVAYGATILDREPLNQSIAGMHLSRDGRILFQASPSPTASPLPPGPGKAFVDLKTNSPIKSAPIVLVVLMVGLWGLATYYGRSLGYGLVHDVQIVSERIKVLAEAAHSDRQTLQPLIAQVPQFSDIRQLAEAVNVLLARIIKINVTHFLAIEKTLEADRVKTQFLANVSHDLRSPLNTIMGFSELILRFNSDGLNENQKAEIKIINRCGNELLQLINKVLDSAKIEARRMILNREESIPVEILSNALRYVHKWSLPDQIQIETRIQAGMDPVTVDPERLSLALAFMIQFCARGMDEGRIIVQIKILPPDENSADPKSTFHIKVSNTSGGFTEAEAQNLFNGFRRHPGKRGLGLGLPLAKAFIELHDGHLALTSGPGTGTTFTSEIPIYQPKVLAKLQLKRAKEDKPEEKRAGDSAPPQGQELKTVDNGVRQTK